MKNNSGSKIILPIGNITEAISDLGAIVRRTRKKSGLTQAETAGLCGVGNRFLSDLENGKPTLEIGKVLQVLQRIGLNLRVEERQAPWRS